jgi:hypothetical protein
MIPTYECSRLADEDPDLQLKLVKLGGCRNCSNPDARNMICLPYRIPNKSTTGWNCGICDAPKQKFKPFRRFAGFPPLQIPTFHLLEPKGAVTVLCDACFQEGNPIEWAVIGDSQDGKRIHVSELKDFPFTHDTAAHLRFKLAMNAANC